MQACTPAVANDNIHVSICVVRKATLLSD